MCSIFQLAKSTRLPCQNSIHKSAAPFDKIHCDLWGPTPVLATDNSKYFVAFVDNCTSFIWFYPLNKKSDFFTVFLAFDSLAQRQFTSKIKCFQFDGGGEFL